MKTRRITVFLGLTATLWIPSAGQVQKYFGTWGILIYGALVFSILVTGSRFILNPVLRNLTEKKAFWLAVLTFLALLVIFYIVFPIANSGIVGGGSDNDEDFTVAIKALWHGRYPYYAKTYLGNSLSTLPGGLLLALPFVLLGNSAYQNLFWLGVFFLAARSFLKDGRQALFLFWSILLLSPVVLQQLVTGYSGVANAVCVLFFMGWLVGSILEKQSAFKKFIAAIFFGIALAWRSNYLLLLPLVFSILVQNVGWKTASQYTVLSFLAFCALTIPFYLYDPAGFSPLAVHLNRLVRFQSILPYSWVLISLLTAAIALLLSFQRMEPDCRVLFKNCAIVQAIPVLCVLVLSSIQSGRPNFFWSGYGVHFLFFGVLASWNELTRFWDKRREKQLLQ